MSTRKVIIFPDELLARITEWRRQRPELPGESEAIRQLIELGLNVSESADKKKS